MKSHSMRTSVLMCLSIIGALVGALIFFWGPRTSPESKAFVASPEFVPWFFVNELLFAAYPVLAVLLWKPMSQLRKHLHGNKLDILAKSGILLALFILPTLVLQAILPIAEPLPLEHANTKMLILHVVGFFASSLPLSVAIWLTQAAIRDTFGETIQSESNVKDYIRFRDLLQQFLMALGGLLSLFVLTGVALRAAMIGSGAATPGSYPPVYVLIFGVYNTLLLATVYFPAYAALVSAGRRLLDVYFALPAPDSKSWAAVYSNRKELESLLELKVTGEQRFLKSITLLAPFVSSIFSLLME